ncbi:uncharacterized protein BT62DRAFT_559234 [Guyanagaster necrorhizus]|uniref:Uncharacterized protein n=1 Tax=Guyanagaster necrorhizus TaxID=856835 RepID=A0A9P7VIG0_9AGAR|nr:uncharacterized protein BT62DRAFT_559234 [Guyanagaster necrorhizus MCA 3950]KAG7440955.1 hypothetical protein BT62DRAFT_559234 [Guyanagaster necrorhizus MCA 3950]
MHRVRRDLRPSALFPLFHSPNSSEGEYAGHVSHAHCISAFIRDSSQVAGFFYTNTRMLSRITTGRSTSLISTSPVCACLHTSPPTCSISTSPQLYQKCAYKLGILCIESIRLAECLTFVRKKNEQISWDLLFSRWMNGIQDQIAKIAPALLAITSTCAVNKEARKQLEEASNHTAPNALLSSNNSTPTNMTRPQHHSLIISYPVFLLASATIHGCSSLHCSENQMKRALPHL